MVPCLVTLTDLQTHRAGLSASAELLVLLQWPVAVMVYRMWGQLDLLCINGAVCIQRWLFSSAFDAISQWQFTDLPSMSDHLKVSQDYQLFTVSFCIIIFFFLQRTDFTVFVPHVYGSLWRWKHWSVRQIKPAELAFGRTLIQLQLQKCSVKQHNAICVLAVPLCSRKITAKQCHMNIRNA